MLLVSKATKIIDSVKEMAFKYGKRRKLPISIRLHNLTHYQKDGIGEGITLFIHQGRYKVGSPQWRRRQIDVYVKLDDGYTEGCLPPAYIMTDDTYEIKIGSSQQLKKTSVPQGEPEEEDDLHDFPQ
jgi:hypothetical protein